MRWFFDETATLGRQGSGFVLVRPDDLEELHYLVLKLRLE